MSRNDAEDFAQRLYSRIPGQYRVYDQEQGLPLLALMRVIGEQVANLRQDLDALWDNFFIETCEDWVVPYIGALVGTNLLSHPVGQSNRLDVWNTILWRRSKGTPKMLSALASDIAGWPLDLAEFFQSLGWSQNMNHLRLDHPLTADVHDTFALSLLGHSNDPFAHAADFKPAQPLDQPRVTRNALGIGIAAWGTPGRHQIRNLGFFARRLQTFAVNGATPAAAIPGATPPANAAFFTFDPLFRDVPLFVKNRAEPLTRAAFNNAPWNAFGTDIAVRQSGVLLASEVQPKPATSASTNPFTFGGLGAGLQLDPVAGMRLLNAADFDQGAAHFTIAAEWQGSSGSALLGVLSTFQATAPGGSGFHAGVSATEAGKLVITVRNGFPGLPPSAAASFPGAVIAARATRSGPLRSTDALYIYLPAGLVTPAAPMVLFVADDGSTYARPDFNPQSLARGSEGRVFPPRPVAPSAAPALGFVSLNRKAAGIRLLDPSRFGTTGAGIEVRAEVCTGDFQSIGAVASASQTGATVSGIPVPSPWPANQFLSSTAALSGNLPQRGFLSLHVSALGGTALPESELILINRLGQGLLVYLPEFPVIPASGADLFVADDGSTYFAPSDQARRLETISANSLASLPLARAASGQVLPIAGRYPVQQRRPVALNLCQPERAALLEADELGIDPELGRFAFAPGDPLIGQNISDLSVDYVEAFPDRIGALNFDRLASADPAATRFVSRTGDAQSPLASQLSGAPVHTSVADAMAAARDGDVIEISDSATYASSTPATLSKPSVRSIIVRAAAGQRPCLAFYSAAGVPSSASIVVTSAMDSLELNGILVSGGPITIGAPVSTVHVIACALDPQPSVGMGSFIATDANRDSNSDFVFCRSITGPLQVGAGVGRLTLADSIVDAQGGLAIGGAPPAGSRPAADRPANLVQLERATVLGRIHCLVLNASESLLNDVAIVDDQQTGCVRFTRFELNSILPRRFQSIPTEDQARASKLVRCLAPVFASMRYGRPNYLQLAAGCPPEILSASADGAEVGAFASALNPIRLGNMLIKLREFMPAGLSAVVIGET